MVGGRDADTANIVIEDLKNRLANRVQLTTDGYRPYLDAVEQAFGGLKKTFPGIRVSERASLQISMKWAQVAVLLSVQTLLLTDTKSAGNFDEMGICTFARSAIPYAGEVFFGTRYLAQTSSNRTRL